MVFSLAIAGLSGIVAADVLAAEGDEVEELELVVELEPTHAAYYAGYAVVPNAVLEQRAKDNAEPKPIPEPAAETAKPKPRVTVKKKRRKKRKKGLRFGRMDAY